MKVAALALTLAAAPAVGFAADLPRTAPLPPPPPLFTWTGYYAGTFMGFGGLTDSAKSVCTPNTTFLRCQTTPNVPHPGSGGFIAGGEVGYDYQFANGVVLGVEGDDQFTHVRGFGLARGQATLNNGQTVATTYNVGDSLDALGTVRGRIGYAFGRTLLYATGGAALGEVTLTATRSDGGDGVTANRQNWRFGYVAGGGIEYAFSDHLSVKLEGDYFDLGSHTVTGVDTGGLGLRRGATVQTAGYLARAGLNVHFGDGLPFADMFHEVMSPDAVAAPAAPGAWTLVSGLRYFYSVGEHRHTLYSAGARNQLQSRLTYADTTAHAGETFARLDNIPTGLFLKGFVGSGGIVGGHLNDQDFPPLARYSNTLSKIQDGDLSYATVDAGYDFWRTPTWQVGGFLGYAYYADSPEAYGCRQLAMGTGTTTCGTPKSTNTLILSEDEAWNALRVGGTLRANWNRFHATLDAAYLPVTSLDAFDHHWLKPSSNPRPQTGTGDGYQLEGVLAYDVTRNLSVGAGARYWHFDSSGSTNIISTTHPLQVQSNRYGGFLQASYRFLD